MGKLSVVTFVLALSASAGANLLTADAAWNARAFSGETRYTWQTDADGEYVCGEARGTASLRVRRVDVNLAQTPYLTWRWRVPATIADLPQRTRAGDDFPARVYVVSRAGMRVRTLAFVWAHAPAALPWPNPFDANTIVIPLRHGDAEGWQTELVDVRGALRDHFDIEDPAELGIGFMTDGDNSGSVLSGCYRDFEFVAAPSP